VLRRRRPTEREIAFSFDSFLDVVTNVVGIVLRLILVAWVGARTYKGPPPPQPPTLPAIVDTADLPEPEDPLAAELARQRRELLEAQARLAEQVAMWQRARDRREPTAQELAALRQERERLEDRRAALERAAGAQGQDVRTASLSLAEVQERGRKLTAEIDALRRAPPAKQALRYRTPISHPLQTEELLFELRGGRIAFVDIGALIEDVRQAVRDKSDGLQLQPEISAVTPPTGPFQLRYHLERQRQPGGGLRVSLTGWEVEAIANDRGETADEALKPGSAFRRVIEAIDPQQTAVTFFTYPDSFPLYRRLRDYLHEHDVVVAGRPLPVGVPIASSRRGTASRGQ
jgi:hypothetical protein